MKNEMVNIMYVVKILFYVTNVEQYFLITGNDFITFGTITGGQLYCSYVDVTA